MSDGLSSTSQIVTLGVTETNVAPTLLPLVDQTVSEGTVITFTAVATDSDLPVQSLTFSLLNGPAGAVISGTGGGFSWATDGFDGGSSYTATVQVSDGTLVASQTVTLTVTEINTPPIFIGALTAYTVDEGDTVSLFAPASDPDLPAQPLTYSLSNAPAGMTISQTGRISWTTSEVDGPAVFSDIRVWVSDGTTTVSQSFVLTVSELNIAPVMTDVADITVDEGDTISFTVMVTDTDLPTQSLRYSLGGDETNASFSDGLFSWPTTEADGDELYDLTLLVSDGVATSSQAIVITVTEINNAPVLSPIADVTLGEGGLVSFRAVATDSDRPAQTLTYTLLHAPEEAAIGEYRGNFAWLTTVDDGPGTYSVTVQVTDGTWRISRTVYITVTEENDPPVITPVVAQTVTETETISFTVFARDNAVQDLRYSLDASSPERVQINQDGDFYWTTEETDGPGIYPMTVYVSDGLLTSTTTITVIVLEDNSPVSLEPIADQTVNEVDLLTATLVISDADLPTQAFSFTVSGLTNGASVGADHILRWQTTEADGGDIFIGTVTVNDGYSTASQSFVVTVTEINNVPAFSGSTALTVSEGLTLSTVLSGTDDSGAIGFSATGIPSGASYDAATGQLVWPTAELDGPSLHTVTVRMTDTTGLTATVWVTITVLEENRPPLLADLPAQTLLTNQQLALTMVATDTDRPANQLTYSLIEVSDGVTVSGAVMSRTGRAQVSATNVVTLHPATGALNWSPTETGRFTLTVQVADDGVPVLTDTTVLTVSVVEPTLSLTKRVTPTEVTPGDMLTYTLILHNQTDFDATNVRLTDTLPLSLTGASLSWQGTLTAQTALTFTLSSTVPTPTPWGTTITNTASFSSALSAGTASVAVTLPPVEEVYLPTLWRD